MYSILLLKYFFFFEDAAMPNKDVIDGRHMQASSPVSIPANYKMTFETKVGIHEALQRKMLMCSNS